jgi:hypothetical protein
MDYQAGKLPLIRIRRKEYERMRHIIDASGGGISYADIIEKALNVLDASGGGMLPGFWEQHPTIKENRND